MKEIKAKAPLHPKIREHIPYYYFLQENDPESHFEFWHYPHYYSTLNICKNSQVIINDETRYVLSNKEREYVFVYSQNTKRAKKAILQGSHDIIGVVFNPLGINHFLSTPSTITKQEYILNEWGDTFNHHLKRVFDTPGLLTKTRLLDELFQAIYRDFQAPILDRALSQVINSKGNISLNELCALLKVNRRTLLRYFKQHLGYSFRDFKAVVKFRTALHQGVKEMNPTKLGHLAYNAHYYDQSDFIKHFKSKTNETPKRIINQLSTVTDQLFWKLA